MKKSITRSDVPVTSINPAHYRSHPSGVECIEITRHSCFNIGNVIKYLWRADLKDYDVEDMKKALWYLNDEINLRKNKEKENEECKA